MLVLDSQYSWFRNKNVIDIMMCASKVLVLDKNYNAFSKRDLNLIHDIYCIKVNIIIMIFFIRRFKYAMTQVQQSTYTLKI